MANKQLIISRIVRKIERKNTPDFVILDLNLPKRTGHEVLKVIRESKTFGALAVVVLSTAENIFTKSRSWQGSMHCMWLNR